jgi:hypothetical protein
VVAAAAHVGHAGPERQVTIEAPVALIAGTPEHCNRRLRDFIDAGINEPVLGLLGSAENCRLALDVMREFTA